LPIKAHFHILVLVISHLNKSLAQRARRCCRPLEFNLPALLQTVLILLFLISALISSAVADTDDSAEREHGLAGRSERQPRRF
jgi:hypothetical protein